MWRATCVQMESAIAAPARDREGALAIIGQNVDRATRLINEACDGPAPPRLVVLPEFALQGPPHGEGIAEWIAKACDTIPGRITERLQELASRRRIFIAGNQFEIDPRWPGRFFNCCFLIDPAGDVILRYRRINTAVWPSPHDFMDRYLADVGAEGAFPVVDTELGRLAMIACGEICVPEVARVFMMRGAEVILHPTNEERMVGQEAAKVARAAENMAYLISANVAGPIGFSADRKTLGGRSHIIDFRGRSVAYEEGAQECVTVSADIDIRALRAARNDTGMANTIARARWDMYRPFYDGARGYPANQFLDSPMGDVRATEPVVAASLDGLVRLGVVVRA